MPKTVGTIATNNIGTGFIAKFRVDGNTYTYSAKIDTTVVFKSSAATLEYTSIDQLQQNQTYDGYTGQTDLSLTLEGGAKITGNLDQNLQIRSNINGTGNWAAGDAEDE